MKDLRVVLILSLMLFLLVCGKTKNPVTGSGEDPSGFRFESSQSDCGGGSGESTGGGGKGDTVIFSSHGDTIVVIHKDAFYNCCAQIAVNVVETANGFDLFESDTGDLCDCLCYFDITTTLCDLANGSYFIRVFDVYGDPVDSGVVDIPPKFGAFQSSQGECKTLPYKAGAEALTDTLRDSVLVWFDADTVWVMHKNAFENCCSEIQSDVQRTPEGFDIYEYDTAMSGCNCLCYFDLVTTIYGVLPGVYLIRVFDTAGELVDEVELEIPST